MHGLRLHLIQQDKLVVDYIQQTLFLQLDDNPRGSLPAGPGHLRKFHMSDFDIDNHSAPVPNPTALSETVQSG